MRSGSRCHNVELHALDIRPRRAAIERLHTWYEDGICLKPFHARRMNYSDHSLLPWPQPYGVAVLFVISLVPRDDPAMTPPQQLCFDLVAKLGCGGLSTANDK